MKLVPKYSPIEYPLLSKIGYQFIKGNGSENFLNKHLFFMKWINKTYPHTYKDVKEGDCFILWNGGTPPVPFIQIKDEIPDKTNRPTPLIDCTRVYTSKELFDVFVNKML